MIKHEFIAGKSKTGFSQQTVVITIESLKGEHLIEAVNYLIAHVNTIYNSNKNIDDHVMWPIEFHLNDTLVLSESAFWKCVFDSLKGGYEYIQKYIQNLCELTQLLPHNMLLQSDEYNYHGGMAFNQYWLWSIENAFPDTTNNLKLYRQFCLWLSKNDLDFETYQDNIIQLIFDNYSHLDDEGSATLLALRLSDGHRTEKEFDYLRYVLAGLNGNKSPGLLKHVINELYNEEMHISCGIDDSESTIYELSAVVYGSNERCTKDVITYARKIAKTDLYPISDHETKRINYLRQVGDIYWQQVTSQSRYIDTSFHLFDTHTRKWIDYSEREDG